MREKMICPACGAEMNCHAEKLVYSDMGSAAHIAMAERIHEVHTCPQCGRSESRAAATV
jgi:predicted RNA-binding Zn-ribbon protein involved in translation (DUF1610 family)